MWRSVSGRAKCGCAWARAAAIAKCRSMPRCGRRCAPIARCGRSRRGKYASLFISQRGEALTASGVWRMLSKYARQAGLDHVSPHVLRHSFASLLLREQQIDLVTVADLLGHQSVNTTMRYTRSTEANRQAAVEQFDAGAVVDHG